ncbi:TetR/AcrR family transcriptional regulator [Levilactobacillus acidifarinae]|uniref:Transcription regulator n=1 Tax=Levilactobacillus acidifarinae DSM 19394 = JCM 15949 TaxID=1423715 RepID=A0A0R1LUV3_9LACO|nr:TetR/AcrR family transcriptional regulator [Levilactobacillus acidifarinae]KRK96050.1 transcription regulator [Levilactobacillus acidifarinae DSM 19394]GEO69676.1 TetR family transcriptional regulator [Levilactobacillus acidifarinae]
MAATQHAQQIKQDSQTYLTTALLQLLETHDLNTLSVTQVVKRAGVSRMAFYRNFDTLADLLTAYFQPKLTARFNDIVTGVPQAEKLTAIGQFFQELAPTLKLAERRGFEGIIQQIFNQNMEDFYQTILAETPLTSVQQRYWTKFMSAGVYAIWREWLLTGQRESLSTIHDLIAGFQRQTMASLQG